jgi:hypothetical protein
MVHVHTPGNNVDKRRNRNEQRIGISKKSDRVMKKHINITPVQGKKDTGLELLLGIR